MRTIGTSDPLLLIYICNEPILTSITKRMGASTYISHYSFPSQGCSNPAHNLTSLTICCTQPLANLLDRYLQ